MHPYFLIQYQGDKYILIEVLILEARMQIHIFKTSIINTPFNIFW